MANATLLMLIGLLNLRFDLLVKDRKSWVKGQLLNLAIGIPLCVLWVYLTLPALIPFVGYTVILLPLGLNALITIIIMAAEQEKTKQPVKWAAIPSLLLVGSLLISLYLNLVVVPIRSQALRDVPNVTVSTEQMPVMNLENIRLVPQENAYWKAKQIIGNMGAGFEVGNLSVQMVEDTLFWVAPLEFRGFFQWRTHRESPGFIMVNAQDPDASAVFHPAPMVYQPSAYFSSDLNRHVYKTYNDVLLLEASFEVDDNYKPWYVMSIGVPTVGKTGRVVTGVILVDPATGEMTEYALEDVPIWVDQVIPEFLAEKHNSWFGRYVHGFWNSLFAQRDVHVPTKWSGGPDVFGVVGPDKRFYWFTGHTSASSKDDSLMGYTMTDGRTGEIIYYKEALGLFNESAAVAAVDAAVANFAGWHGAQPLLYNLYGTESYVIPVLSSNDILQAIGIVHARTGHAVVRPTKLEAVMAYRQFLGQGSGDIIPTDVGHLDKVQGVVTRIGSAVINGNTLFFFSIAGEDRIFTASAGLSSHVALTQVGDRIEVSFLETAEPVVALAVFSNLSLSR